MDYAKWLDANFGRVDQLWQDHIQQMSGSQASDHVNRVANSDKCFEEFSEEIFETENGDAL